MKTLPVTLGIMIAGITPIMAQKTFTLPAKGIQSKRGVGIGMIVPRKSKAPSRQQCLYATADLPVSPIKIREVAFQPNAPMNFGQEAVAVTLTLDLSISPLRPRQWSTTFAANLGPVVKRVFSGTIKLPKVTSTTPQGWYFRIPLQTPFVADKTKGKSLVLDFSTSSVVTNMRHRWELMQTQTDFGGTEFQGIGFNCHFYKMGYLFQFLRGRLIPNSAYGWEPTPLPPKQPGFLMIGDAGWGSRWASLTLPIDLTAFGAPRCTLEVRPLVLIPFVVDSKGRASVWWVVPPDPKLVNVKFYMQGSYRHPKANALGWLFMPSLVMRIGSGVEHNAASLANWNWDPKVKPPYKWGMGLLGDPAPWCRITY